MNSLANRQLSFLDALFFTWLMNYLILPLFIGLGYLGINLPVNSEMGVLLGLCLCFLVHLFDRNKQDSFLPKLDGGKKIPIITMGVVILCFIYATSYVYGIPPVVSKTGVALSMSDYFPRVVNQVVLKGIFFLIIGLNISQLFKYFKQKRIKNILFINYLVYFAIIIIICIENNRGILEPAFIGGTDNGYYLAFGDAFLITSVMFTQLHYGEKKKKWIVLASLILLFKIGSRTDLICYLAFIICDILARVITNREKYKKSVVLLTIWSLCTLTILASLNLLSGTVTIEKLAQSDNIQIQRMVAIINSQEIGEDASVVGRNRIHEENMEDLKNIWIFGRVLREAEEFSDIGHYSHNITSYWTEFGIVPFVLIIGSLVLGSIRIIKVIYIKRYSENLIIASIYFAWLPAALFSRSYIYPITWILISSAYLVKIKKSEEKKNERNISIS